MAPLIARVGPCRLRSDDGHEPYFSLLRAITGQQLHSRAAATIFGRFLALAGGAVPHPDAILSFTDEEMRGCGLSGSKVAAIRGVAEARLTGIVPDRAEASALSDEDLIKRLVTLRGIGRWTVEMLLIFSLDRPDVMPVDDFGIREGWRRIKGADAQLKPRELTRATEMLGPWRSVAAWYLWRAADEGKKPANQNPMTA